VSAPSSSSIERRSRAEAKAGEGNDPGLRRGSSEPRSSAEDSVGEGKLPGVASAFSRVGVARATRGGEKAAAPDRFDAEAEGDARASEGGDEALLPMEMEERSGVAGEVDDVEQVDAIIAERQLLLRAAAMFLCWFAEGVRLLLSTPACGRKSELGKRAKESKRERSLERRWKKKSEEKNVCRAFSVSRCENEGAPFFPPLFPFPLASLILLLRLRFVVAFLFFCCCLVFQVREEYSGH
jgi:hypothetical protein